MTGQPERNLTQQLDIADRRVSLSRESRESLSPLQALIHPITKLIEPEDNSLPPPADGFDLDPKVIRVGLISPELRHPEDFALPSTEKQLGDTRYLLHSLNDMAISDLRASYKELIPRLGALRCHFICIPELCYPKSHSYQENLEFEQFLTAQSVDNGCYILAGSFHCQATFRNRVLIVSPNQDEPNLRFHDKLTSAVRVEERIVVPSYKHVGIYETAYGRFAVLICLDSYDPMIAAILANANERQGHRYHPIRLVFVPSFNRDKRYALEVVRGLSTLSGCCVILNNGFRDGPKSAVVLGGNLVEPVDSFESRGVRAEVFDIAVDDIQDQLNRSTLKQSPEVRFVLGFGGSYK